MNRYLMLASALMRYVKMKPEWYKNKRVWYGLLLVLAGVFGGNVDRVNEFFPEFTGDNTELVQRVENLEQRVLALESVGSETNANLDRLLDVIKKLNAQKQNDDL